MTIQEQEQEVIAFCKEMTAKRIPASIYDLHFIGNSDGNCMAAGVGSDGKECFWTNDWNFGRMMNTADCQGLINKYPDLFKGCTIR